MWIGTTGLSHSASLGEGSKEAKSATKLNTKMAGRGMRTDQSDANTTSRGTITAEVLAITIAASHSPRSEATATVNQTITRRKTIRSGAR